MLHKLVPPRAPLLGLSRQVETTMTTTEHSGIGQHDKHQPDKAAGYYGFTTASPFALTPPDNDPLPRLTRTAILWEGPAWTEIDPATGEVIDHGNAEAAA